MALSKIFVLGLIFGFVQLFSVEARVALGHHALPGGLKVTAPTPVTLPVSLPVTDPDLLGKAGELLTNAGNLLSSTPSIPDLGLTTPDLGLTTPDLGLTTPAGDPANNDPMMDMLGKCADMMKDLADMIKAICDNMMNPNGDDSTTPSSSSNPLGITLGSTLPPLDKILSTNVLDNLLGSTTPDPGDMMKNNPGDMMKNKPKGMNNKDPGDMMKNKPKGMNNKRPNRGNHKRPSGMNNNGQPDNYPDYSDAESAAFAKSGGQPDNYPDYSDAESAAFAKSGGGKSMSGAYAGQPDDYSDAGSEAFGKSGGNRFGRKAAGKKGKWGKKKRRGNKKYQPWG